MIKPVTARRHRRGTETSVRSPALSMALWYVGGSLILCAALEQILIVTGGRSDPLWVTSLFPVLALGYGAAGLLAWGRRPSNRVGAVLVLAGWFWLLAGLANTGITVLIALGFMCSTLVFAVLVHLLLVYPTGRTSTPWARPVIGWAYVTCTVFELPLYFFDPDGTTPLQLADRPDLDLLFTRIQLWLFVIALVAALVLVTLRFRAGTPATRRALGPVAGYVFAALALGLLSPNVFVPLFGWDPLVLFIAQVAALAIVPVAFVLGVLLGGFARTGEIVELGAWFRQDRDPSELSGALARTLGDPAAQVAFWMDGSGRYVDVDGSEVDVDAVGPGRAVELIVVDGRPVGAIVYDATLVGDRELVRTAGRVLAIAVDRQRLTVELTASRDALRRSRARIVEEGDRARRRLARDLHDGLQGRLVALAIQAQQLTKRLPEQQQPSAADLRAGLDGAIQELRSLVHNVMPALLLERGLRAATEEIVDRMPIPTDLEGCPELRALPPTVESAAFYVVAEGLANGLKHSHADRMRVRMELVDEELRIEIADNGVGGALAGSGLRGLEDRVDALGGRLTVESPPGGGTTMLALMPCA
jgi:signal transduction histidine kinase